MVGWAAAPTWIETISPTAKANRMLMVQAMLGAGFSNCRDEYWHYSYGDSAWAVRVGSRECSYGLVKPPPCRRRDEQC
jgi:D-alanyl-D-alanine dipeptidase